MNNPEVALLFQQRLGKTWIATGVIHFLRPKKTLICVPLSNKESTWVKWIKTHCPEQPLTVVIGKIKRDKLIEIIKSFKSGILLLHYESLNSVVKWLRKIDWDLMIYDEGHRLKDRGSLSSRTAAKLSHAKRKILLTGTPIDSYPSDLWAQFRWLKPDIFGTRWKDFDQEYMQQPSANPMQFRYKSIRWRREMMMLTMQRSKLKFRMEMLPRFIAKVQKYCWRAELPSPEPNFNIVWVTMRGDQRRLYHEFRRKRVVKIDGARVMGKLKITYREKLYQMCNGFVFDDNGEPHLVGRAKFRKLKILTKRMRGPNVIFCRYVPEIEALEAALPGRVATLYGATPREQRAIVQADFQAGKIDNLICQERTGGVGIDLYRAKRLIVFSMNHSFIDFAQMVARIRLPEQTEPTDIFLLVVEDSIDEERLDHVMGKDRRTRKVLGHLKRG